MQTLQDKLEKKIYDYEGLTSDVIKPGFIVVHPYTFYEFKREMALRYPNYPMGPFDFEKNTYRGIPFIDSKKIAEGEFSLTL